MHRSGIQVSAELKSAFEDACNTSVGVIKYQISGESFTQVQTIDSSGSMSGDFDAARAALDDRAPCYMLVRKDDATTKFLFVSYCPENANVREKMLYSSSRSSLKDGLGAQKFVDDYFCSERRDCSLVEYERSISSVAADVMTLDERIAEAHVDAMKSQQVVKLAAMQDVPIKITQSTDKAFKDFHAGTANALYLQLDMATEALTSHTEGKSSASDVASHLPHNEPMFVLFRYAHNDSDGKAKTAVVFIYYCPDVAVPKQKMFYSSTKSMVLKVATHMHVHVDKNLEISEVKEMSDAAILNELYPKEAVKKVISKPKRQGKGINRVRAKFDPTK